jgi:hypothetical protein
MAPASALLLQCSGDIHKKGLAMNIRTLSAIGLTALLLTGFGCATYYVNIPPQAGDIANHDPNHKTVLEVETVAIKAVVDKWRLKQPFTVKALADTEPRFYFEMMPRISRKYAMADQIEGTLMIEVRQLYIRGSSARVDLVRSISGPVPGRPPQPMTADVPGGAEAGADPEQDFTRPTVVTVELHQAAFGGWTAKRIKPWNAPVEQALLSSAEQP